jgi:hypothetical protein
MYPRVETPICKSAPAEIERAQPQRTAPGLPRISRISEHLLNGRGRVILCIGRPASGGSDNEMRPLLHLLVDAPDVLTHDTDDQQLDTTEEQE